MFTGCQDDYEIEHGHVDYPDNETAVNQSLPVSCNAGYEISGDHRITCLDNGTWSNTTTCIKIGLYLPKQKYRVTFICLFIV